MSIVRRVELRIRDQKTADRMHGLPLRDGTYRTPLAAVGVPATVAAYGGAVELEIFSEPAPDGTPWLGEAFASLLVPPRPLNPKGEDDAPPEIGRARALAAVREITGDAPRLGIDGATIETLTRYAKAAADICFSYGVPLARAATVLKLEHVDVPRIVQDVYANGSILMWGGLAFVVDANEREAAQAQEEASSRARLLEAQANAMIERPGVERGFDGLVVADSHGALAVAPGPIQVLMQGRLVAGIRNGGFRVDKERQLGAGVAIRRPDFARPMKRRDVNAIPVIDTLNLDPHSALMAGFDFTREVALAHEHDERAVREDEYRDLRDPGTWFSLEQIDAAAEALWERSFRVLRVREKIANLYRGHAIHPEIAISRIIERAKSKFEELNPEPPNFAAEEERRCKSVMLMNGDEALGHPAPRAWRKVWPMPEGWTERSIVKVVRRVYEGGLAAEITPGALIVPPPRVWLDRFYAETPALDPWRNEVAELIEGKPHVRNAEIEAALRERGHIDGENTPPTVLQRLHALLTSLGRKKQQVPAPDGTRPKVWVADEGAS